MNYTHKIIYGTLHILKFGGMFIINMFSEYYCVHTKVSMRLVSEHH